VNLNEKLIYKNELGQSVEFSCFSPFFIEGFEESTANDISTSKNTGQDGEIITNDTLDKKYISLRGIIAADNLELMRREFKKIFNPRLNGQLTYSSETLEKDRIISCKPAAVPEVLTKKGLAKFDLELVCASPFWQEQEKVEYIALLTPKLKFPLVIPMGGMVFGFKKSILQTEVQNIGDASTGFRVIFKAKGSVDNPKIINALTGDFIRIKYAMQKDEFIEVINYPDKKQITVNGTTNGFKYLDIASTFFDLIVGKNLIGYLADLNTVNLDVIVYYTPRYLGV
jgi:hypothetical protein